MMQRASAVVLALAVTSQVLAATPTTEQMWELIQKQQAEIDALQRRLADTDNRISETVVRVDATADMVEQSGGATVAPTARWVEQTRLGGYAEMHLNKLDNDLEDGDDKDELDFHRFVLFVNHSFSPRTRFYSELELEHSISGESKKGEIELEQAFIEHDIAGSHRARAGLFLIPVGLINETHEPDTFYGVERNNVESRIIPATWWEGGVGAAGEIAPGLAYDLAATSGLFMDPTKGQWAIRDGRQKVSFARADDPAYTARLKYTGIAGLELATTAQYQQDLYQGEFAEQVEGILYEAHAAWQRRAFGLRALYAGWDIDEGIEFFKSGADRQQGWYVEPSWRLSPEWGVFARYSEWDNQAGSNEDTQYAQWDVGVNYWLEERVVLKFDYQRQDAPEGKDQLDGVNLGVGLSF